MERNHNKTASQEKSLEEMRRGFNSKAEDMFKSNNSGLFVSGIILVLIVVFGILNRHYHWLEIDYRPIAAVVGLTVLGSFVLCKAFLYYYRAVEHTEDSLEHLQAAKKLKRVYQLIKIFGFICDVAFYVVLINVDDGWANVFTLPLLLVVGLIWLRFRPNAFVDMDFCQDLDGLEACLLGE